MFIILYLCREADTIRLSGTVLTVVDFDVKELLGGFRFIIISYLILDELTWAFIFFISNRVIVTISQVLPPPLGQNNIMHIKHCARVLA